MSSTVPLTFHWPEKRVSRAFAGFLSLSLIVHLAGFYAFQVVYPPAAGVLPPPAHVFALDASNPEHASLLSWIAAEDPALTARPPDVSPGLPEVSYTPFYDSPGTAPIVPEFPETPVKFSSGVRPPELVNSVIRQREVSRKPIHIPDTRLRMTASLAGRLPNAPDLPEIVPDDRISLTQFLAGVAADGTVAFLFLHKSSGNENADRKAHDMILSMKFEPRPDAKISWGVVTCDWGARDKSKSS